MHPTLTHSLTGAELARAAADRTLHELISDAFALTAEASRDAATCLEAALRATWSAQSIGESFENWVACLPPPLARCLAELAAQAAASPRAGARHLHVARTAVAELATAVGNYA